MDISDFKGTHPAFVPEEFFKGQLEGWAIVQGPLGGLQRRATIEAKGKQVDGVIHFTENWTFDDGQIDTLAWQINATGDGAYKGREPSLEGEAAGECAGCAFHWTYTRNVPGKDGSSSTLNFDDWFFRIDESVAMVVGTAGRLGLPFGSATVTYRKLSGEP